MEDIIVYSGILENDKVENIKSFKGTKKEVIEFMNKNYTRNEIITYFNNKSVFCFKENIKDLSNWKTLEQLINENIITLKGSKK